MKNAIGVVTRVRGIKIKCELCKGADWRRRVARFAVEIVRDLRPRSFSYVCRDHLRDAVLEVWK